MDFLTWGRSPWGEWVLTHVSWDLLWASIFAGVVFLVAHASYMVLSAHRKREAHEADALERPRQEFLGHLEAPVGVGVSDAHVCRIRIENRAPVAVLRRLFAHHFLVAGQGELQRGLREGRSGRDPRDRVFRLRAEDPGVQKAVGMEGADPVAVFTELRERKNKF